MSSAVPRCGIWHTARRLLICPVLPVTSDAPSPDAHGQEYLSTFNVFFLSLSKQQEQEKKTLISFASQLPASLPLQSAQSKSRRGGAQHLVAQSPFGPCVLASLLIAPVTGTPHRTPDAYRPLLSWKAAFLGGEAPTLFCFPPPLWLFWHPHVSLPQVCSSLSTTWKSLLFPGFSHYLQYWGSSKVK